MANTKEKEIVPEGFAAGFDDAIPAKPESDTDELRLRIMELEDQLAAKQAEIDRRATLPLQSTEPQVMAYWEVSLLHQPTLIVMAVDAANAWQEYRRLQGVVASEFEPQIGGSNKDAYDAQNQMLARQRGEI